MKLKSDFITNSSSSSFIIAIRSPEYAERRFGTGGETYSHLYYFIRHFIINKASDDEVEQYLKDTYDCGLDCEGCKESECSGRKMTNKVEEYKNEGYEMFCMDFDYSEETLDEFLEGLSESCVEFFKVIHED